MKVTAVEEYCVVPTRLPRRSSGLLDTRAFAHVDAGVSEELRHRDRNGMKGTIATPDQRGVGGQRQFGRVELPVFQHARKHLARTQDLHFQIDAFRLDEPVDQRAGAVVVPAGKRQFQIGH